ncbi:MAG: hypothetical protein WBV39_00200 [Rudaea sp.]
MPIQTIDPAPKFLASTAQRRFSTHAGGDFRSKMPLFQQYAKLSFQLIDCAVEKKAFDIGFGMA